tara:strand:- start:100 stop:384 length:285 start_codon:yes stop_codon:yes gene_type:complete
MAQWEHKEATWYPPIRNNIDDGRSVSQISLIDGVLVKESWSGQNAGDENKFVEKAISFPQWLDFQCLEGWEVFKISKDFNNSHGYTWCVFRRLV